jgi:Zn-dependent protease with chaperone function
LNEDKSTRYHRLKRRSAIASIAISTALLAVLLTSGLSASIAALAHRGSQTDAAVYSPLAVAVYVLLVVGLHEACTFPIAFYQGLLLERRYGLSKEATGGWLADHAKASVLGLVLSLAAAETIYLSMRVSATWWWLLSAAAFIAAIAGLTRLAPVLLLPLFYRFTPLARESLRDRLVSLSDRAGVPVLGVYEWGLGEKSRRANAALVGTGATRRILLSDTLLAEYSEDEIEVILAHEIAHHVHHDIRNAFVAESALLVLALYAGAAALAVSWQWLGLLGVTDIGGLPVLALAGGLLTMAATPIVNAVSRRNERRADRFAITLTKQPAAFISAMKRLGTQNLAEEHPSKLVLWLFHSHPPIEQRIEAARSFL